MKSETAVAQNLHSLLWERHIFAVSMKTTEAMISLKIWNQTLSIGLIVYNLAHETFFLSSHD